MHADAISSLATKQRILAKPIDGEKFCVAAIDLLLRE
jgi:hypothetical protein